MEKTIFNIFGRSNATISMILESLYKLHNDRFEAIIIQNIEVEDNLPYKINNINCKAIMHNEWKTQANDLNRSILLGVYQPSVKRHVFEFFKNHYNIQLEHYSNLLHPNTEIAKTVKLNNGLNIGPQAVLAPYCEMGNLVTINRAVSIGHHTTIHDLCTINPGVNIAGNCNIGTTVTIGMGANIVDGITIGDNAMITSGSLVTKDVPDNVMMSGVPARIINTI